MTNATISMGYGELKEMAKAAGMTNPTGKSKEELVNFINNGGMEMETTNVVAEVENTEVTETTEVVETPEVSTEVVNELEGVNAEEVAAIDQEEEDGPVQQRGQKWHEVEGAYTYQAGDIVKVIEVEPKQILVGRYVEVVKPSRKRNALKGHLVNDKDGSLQGTLVTFDFHKIVKSSKEELAAHLAAEKQKEADKEAARQAAKATGTTTEVTTDAEATTLEVTETPVVETVEAI